MKHVRSFDGLIHVVFSEAVSVDSVITLCTPKPWHRFHPFGDRQVDDAYAAPVTCLRCATGHVLP